jgi:hypothetical protein
MEDVRRNSVNHWNRFKSIRRGDDILDVLRNMVPIAVRAKMAELENAFVPDEDILAERRQDEQQFDEELRMAGRYCSAFGRELMVAIEQEKGSPHPGTST